MLPSRPSLLFPLPLLISFVTLFLLTSTSLAAIAALPDRPRCITPETTPLPPTIKPATFSACIDIINHITSFTPSIPPDLPLKWSSNPAMHPDMQVPARWRAIDGKCQIDLDMRKGEMGTDR